MKNDFPKKEVCEIKKNFIKALNVSKTFRKIKHGLNIKDAQRFRNIFSN